NDPNKWHLQNDDNTLVEHIVASGYNTAGDFWRITTTDGTKYYFGLNKLPGWSTGNYQTNSDWWVPVCGTPTTDCHGTASTATPMSIQAWQWNLDYVVDPHNNVEVLKYVEENNNYAEHGTGSVPYVRAGYLAEIDYGMRTYDRFDPTKPSGAVG